ncbi:hypothetical protein OROMI_021131 [Orobanche minor]
MISARTTLHQQQSNPILRFKSFIIDYEIYWNLLVLKGNDVKRLSEEMEIKLKNAHKRRLAIKPFMKSSGSKTSVPKQRKTAERNKTQILDVEEEHSLPRSFSLDSKDSRMTDDHHDDIKNNLLKSYYPIKNHLSPRPTYLKLNAHRHRAIFPGQKNVNRVKKSASYDVGMRFTKSAVDGSLISLEHEEKEEVFDDFEEGSGWNLKAFVQYLIVMIVLILTTFTITSMNPSHCSHARQAIRGFRNLYNKTYCSIFRSVGFDFSKVGKLRKREIDVNQDKKWTKDVGGDNMDANRLGGYKIEEIQGVHNCKIDKYHKNEIEAKEKISYDIQEPMILKTEEIYSDFDGSEVTEELETLEMMEEEDVEKEDGNSIGMDENILIKLARFDPYYAAFIVVCVLLATLGILYNSKKSTLTHNTKYLGSFFKTTHSGSLIDSDAVSSSEAKSSYLEFSTGSPSYGSFTVEKKIVKKKQNTGGDAVPREAIKQNTQPIHHVSMNPTHSTSL